MATSEPRLGWIGTGRMGLPMAERLLKAGHDLSIFNRTPSKAQPLARAGGRILDKAADLAAVDLVFSMVSTGKDLEEVYFGPGGVASGGRGRLPAVFIDCSTIAVDESAHLRRRLEAIAGFAEAIGAVPIFIIPASNDGGFDPSRSVLDPATPRAERLAIADDVARARAIAVGATSMPVTSAPRLAASSAFSPVPQPASRRRPIRRPSSARRTKAGCGLPMSHGAAVPAV